MSLNNPYTGLDYVPAYQIASIPFVLSSIVVPMLGEAPVEVKFPYVTKNVTVRNTGGAAIRVGFSVNGVTGSVNDNFFTLNAGDSYDSDFRIARLYMLTDVVNSGSIATIVAGMTVIPSGQLIDNWSGSLGVG